MKDTKDTNPIQNHKPKLKQDLYMMGIEDEEVNGKCASIKDITSNHFNVKNIKMSPTQLTGTNANEELIVIDKNKIWRINLIEDLEHPNYHYD